MIRGLRSRLTRFIEDVISSQQEAQFERIDRLHREVLSLHDRFHDMEAELAQQTECLIEFTRQVEIRDRHDLMAAGERQAVAQSWDLVEQSMTNVSLFPNPTETLEYALSIAPRGGLALEFGVFTGSTLKHIATSRGDGSVYGFDSFLGLPEDWRPGFNAGSFAVEAVPDIVGAQIVVGLFAETLPKFLSAVTEKIDFLHLDCDLYSSTQTVLNLVGPRLKTGSVILFDEYFNYPGWRNHEFRAWNEFVSRTGTQFSYQGYTIDNEQVIVRVESIE